MSISGKDFELLTKPFFETTLTKAGYKVLEVRNQDSGTQNGFDIYLNFIDKKNIVRHFYVECKNYTSPLYWKDIFNKQYDLHSSMNKIDAFILLSPTMDLSNIDHKAQKNATTDLFKFPTSFLTPNSGVKDILSLDLSFLKKIIDEDYSSALTESDRIDKFSYHIDALIEEKDFPTRKPPQKNNFSLPDDYISRKVMDAEQKFTGHLFSKGETLYDILKTHDRVSLIGWAGTGKSTEIAVLLHKLSDPNEPFYPFLLKLNVYDDRPIIENVHGLSDIPDHQIVLCLDGLDEVQSTHFEVVTRKIQQFSENYPSAKIVVSCRSNFYTTHNGNASLNTLRDFKSYYLSALAYEEIQAYLLKKLPLKKDFFLDEIEQKKLSKLLETPYYLIKLTDQFLKNGKVADSKADLFEEVINSNIDKDIARYRNDKRDVSAANMRTLLQKLAFILEYQGKNHTTTEELLQFMNADEVSLLKASSSNVYGEEGAQSIWQFNHNNTQEYLTAKVLSEIAYQDIKNIIAFPPDFKKIKPSWANTLSFLLGILPKESSLRNSLLDSLVKNEPELLVKFEPDKLDDHVRFQIFKGIFDYYKKEKRWINRTKFSSYELSKFSQTSETLQFLVTELANADSINTKRNALQLMEHFSRDLVSKSQLLKSVLKQNLVGDSEYPSISFRVYIELFDLSTEELEEIMKLYSGSTDSSCRYILFGAIHKNDLQDYYIDYILEQIRIVMHKEMEDSNRISNEYHELVECVKKIKTDMSLHKILQFFSKEYNEINGSIYFKEIIEPVFALSSEKYEKDPKIYDAIRSLFIENANVYDGSMKPFIEYFERCGGILLVFTTIIKDAAIGKDFGLISRLASIADNGCLVEVVNAYKAGLIDYDTALSFQYNLNINKDLQQEYSKMLNSIGSFPVPVIRDFEYERKSRDQETKELIFNQDKFKMAIEVFFANEGKDMLTYADIRSIHSSRFEAKYLPVIYEITHIDEGGTLEKDKVIKWLEDHWPHISISHITKFLKSASSIALTGEENAIVKKWCDEALLRVKFTEALSYPDESRTTFDRDAIRLSYLIRKLKIVDYQDSLYLDMLSFIKFDDTEIEIFEFVENVVSLDSINKQVVSNIANGIKYYPILQAHLKHCEKYNLKQVTPDLLKYLFEHRSGMYDVLDVYLKLGGSIPALENCLLRAKGELGFRLISVLVENKSTMIKSYLLRELDKQKDDDLRLRYAGYLIMLNDAVGLDEYIKYIKMYNLVPDLGNIRFNPMRRLRSLNLLSRLFRLHELSYLLPILHDRFNDLRETSVSAIQEISLANDNFWKSKKFYSFYKAKFQLGKFFHLNRMPNNIITVLDNQYESMEQQYYTNKGTNITLQEAIQASKSIKF